MTQEIRCLDDLDEFGSEILDPLEALKQDNYHRLITPPGGNIDDPDFGLGLDRLLSGDAAVVSSLGARIEAELRKDSRNAQVATTLTELPGSHPQRGRRYRIAIAIVTDDEQLLPMNLIAGVDGVELV